MRAFYDLSHKRTKLFTSRSVLCSLIIIFSAFTFQIKAQTLQQTMEQMSNDIATDYASSALNALGANLNGGWLNKAVKPNKMSLDINFGFIGMGGFLNKDVQTFRRSGTFFLTKEQAAELTTNIDNPDVRNQVIDQLVKDPMKLYVDGTTLVGDKFKDVRVIISTNGKTTYKVHHPDYPFSVDVEVNAGDTVRLDMGGFLRKFPMLPTAVPQLQVGTLYGTQTTLRFFPSIDAGKDAGKFSMFAFGLTHNPAVWFDEKLPVDFSVGFMVQKISLSKLGAINTSSYGLTVSRNFGSDFLGITPYTGFMLESSSFDFTYNQSFNTDHGEENVALHLNMKGSNKARYYIGFVAHLSVVNLQFDYNMAKNNSITGGLIFSF